jgi:hypothetical protein
MIGNVWNIDELVNQLRKLITQKEVGVDPVGALECVAYVKLFERHYTSRGLLRIAKSPLICSFAQNS